MTERSKTFFPLRTSVELFQDPHAPAAQARAKQGAILFDELIFEPGIYEVTMIPAGSFSTTRSADGMSDEELVHARVTHETGTPMTISVGVQRARGVPASPSAMRPIMQGGITRHYVAEWESVLRELSALKAGWARVLDFDDRALRSDPAGELIARRDRESGRNEQLLADVEDQRLREWTYKSFNRDTVIAEELGATVNVTARFRSLIDPGQMEPAAVGEHALECFIPDLQQVPWENVIRFRDHAGAREAREKLAGFERSALDSDPANGLEFFKRLSSEINSDLIQAWDETKPSLGLDVFRQGLTAGVSTLLPIVGPVSSLMETGRHVRRHRRSWQAAIMTLTG